MARKLIWPLWSSYIFTQWGWLILFSSDHFPGQHRNGESPLNTLFLRTFRTGRTHFLSASCIAVEAQHHEESHLIYGNLESTLLDQGFPVEHELDAWNQPHIGTPSCRLQLLLCLQRRAKSAQTSNCIIPVLKQQTPKFATPIAMHNSAQAFSC